MFSLHCEAVICIFLNISANFFSRCFQNLVEKVMILRKAVEMAQGRSQPVTSSVVAEKLSHYADLLAAQGNLNTAISYLGSSNEVIWNDNSLFYVSCQQNLVVKNSMSKSRTVFR